MARKSEQKKPFAEQVSERLIEQLEQGTAPWQRPWKPGQEMRPHNPVSGTKYRGINSVWLAAQGHADPRWMTFKQSKDVGASVRKGETGTKVEYWKFHDKIPKRDENGKPVKDENGKKKMVSVKLEKPRVFMATVFNAEQIEGLPPLETKHETPEWERHEKAEAVLKGSGAKISHDGGNQAYYHPGTDSIHLPQRGQFESSDLYYATALHELGHWTGHESRLDRDLSGSFGSASYAKEELRAEIASMMVGEELGTGHDPSRHAAYVGNWVKALKDDPREIFRASRDAEKIKDMVVEFDREKSQDAEADKETADDPAKAEKGDQGNEAKAVAEKPESADQAVSLALAEKFAKSIEDPKAREAFMAKAKEQVESGQVSVETENIKVRETRETRREDSKAKEAEEDVER